MPGMEPEHTIYSFGAFTLDVARGTLSRDGIESRLRPKAYGWSPSRSFSMRSGDRLSSPRAH